MVSQYVKKVALPLVEQGFSGTGIVSGYGKISQRKSNARQLYWVKLDIVDGKQCEEVGNFHDEMALCLTSSDSSKQVCNGDSGGPFVVRDQNGEKTVVGLVSYGYNKNCGDGGEPQYGVFTKVSHYIPWIMEKIKSY